MLKKIFVRTLIFIAVIFAVIYCYIQMKTIFDSVITTEVANTYNAEIKVSSDCYILRNEYIISSDSNGVYNYLVNEGDKLSKHQRIADVYSSTDDLETHSKVKELNERIEVLENSAVNKKYLKLSISKIDSEIDEYISLFHTCDSVGDYSLAVQNKNEFLTLLNKRHLIVSAEDDYEELIGDIKDRKKQLTDSLSDPTDSVISPQTGHFYSSVDGYEEVFTLDMLKNLTVDSFFEAIDNSSPTDTSNAVGKIVVDFEWYTLCVVDKESSVFYNSGEYYTVSYPYSGGVGIKSLLKSKITQSDRDEVILVFVTDNIPEGFNFVRKQSVQIIRENYNGLKISKDALRIVDGYEGVYILLENVVRFKRCDIICENEDYYIVSFDDPYEDSEEALPYGYLQIYDVVITRGKDLFDGKMVG